MGAACCTAPKDKEHINRHRIDTLNKYAKCSPSWSFPWENRKRVAGEVEDSSHPKSRGNSRSLGAEIKDPVASDQQNHSEGRSQRESLGTPDIFESSVYQGIDISLRSSNLVEVNSLAESLDASELSSSKLSYTIPSPIPTHVCDPIHGHLLHPNTTLSRQSQISPRYHLFRQTSDSPLPGMKSPNNYELSEGRPSLGLSSGSHNLVIGSHGGSSACWSIKNFSELDASSQRERGSFDIEQFGFGLNEIGGGSSRFSRSPSSDLCTCAACSKFLNEKSQWQSSVVSVLVCGHAYHAECLDMMITEKDKYDPACPTCKEVEERDLAMSKKAFITEADIKIKIHKILRNQVIDSSLDSDSDDFYHERIAHKMEAHQGQNSVPLQGGPL
ncbi:hypothetical protein K2173_027980 [Erythroxylum novogranatense]|uniref:RING-type domain-containing protein n=1 Tax=Erythroxylum novogranatense TaxID=1862640 RepID=A0AAV8U4H5_9ROSI|nr:hypothetical protein K2173_027980 [Erythroxylum novogranatense]